MVNPPLLTLTGSSKDPPQSFEVSIFTVGNRASLSSMFGLWYTLIQSITCMLFKSPSPDSRIRFWSGDSFGLLMIIRGLIELKIPKLVSPIPLNLKLS